MALPEALRFNVKSLQSATGGVTSTMVTVAAQELTFPLVSVTVNVTEFAPKLVQSKLVGFATKLAITQLSVELSLMSAAVILAVPPVFKFTEMFLQIAVGNV